MVRLYKTKSPIIANIHGNSKWETSNVKYKIYHHEEKEKSREIENQQS